MSDLPYREIPEPPETVTAGTVMARLADGLGFRYRWATEGLGDADLDRRACPGSMSLGEVMQHIYALVYRVSEHFRAVDRFPSPSSEPAPGPQIRRSTLELIAELRGRLARATNDELEGIRMRARETEVGFWNMLNGPLADALTHVGQVNAWRRLMGIPSPRANVFLGRPPG